VLGSEVPPTVTVVVALIVVEPVVGELITTVHEPVPPDVVQLEGPTKAAPAPPEFVSVNVITVPSGALTKPEPELTFTCPVSVWFVDTALFAVAGVIWMFASTHAFCASGPSPTRPSPVARVSETPPTLTVVIAWIVVVPAIVEVICTVQEPV